MTDHEIAAVAEGFAPVVKAAITAATAPLIARIADLEQRQKSAAEPITVDVQAIAERAAALIPVPKDGANGVDGRDGADAVVPDVEPLIAAAVTKALEAWPKPKDGANGVDGASVDPAEVDRLVRKHVTEAVSALPVPHDGQSVTAEDVAPLIAVEVTKAVSALPVPKDGVSVVDALTNRDGHLVLTFSDGAVKDVGPVVGRDVDMGAVTKTIRDLVDQIPRPADGKDGQDGLGFDDLDLHEDERGVFLKFVRGEQVKEFRLPTVRDCGVYASERAYGVGDGVTYGGSFWIAKSAGQGHQPGTQDGSAYWRLAVKRGADGKPGAKGLDGKDGRDGTPGKDGQKW